MNDLISIIIVNYNSKKWLKKLFDSLRSQTDKNFEIILVDNKSQDDSVEFVSENYPEVKIVISEKNLGFAGGNNLGIKESQGEYTLLLNQDIWIEPDFLERFTRYFKEHNFDVISTLESYYDRKEIKVKDFYTRIDPLGYTISLPKKADEDQFNLCGFCLLFKKELYEKTKGLDSNFFMYIEEIDWFWRLKLLGKKIGLAENLCVYHDGGTSSREMRYFTFLCRNQNIPQMIIKNYAWYNLIWVLPLYVLQNIFEIIFFLVMGKGKIAWSYPEGWFFVVKNLPKIMRERAWVQKNRKVGDWEIMKKYFYWGNAKLIHLISYYKNGK
jgi:GT2 family glycosyltransferase